MTKTNIGSHFDEFLREAGIYKQTQAVAVKRVLAYEPERKMQRAQLTKTDMAKLMGTTRTRQKRTYALSGQERTQPV